MFKPKQTEPRSPFTSAMKPSVKAKLKAMAATEGVNMSDVLEKAAVLLINHKPESAVDYFDRVTKGAK